MNNQIYAANAICIKQRNTGKIPNHKTSKDFSQINKRPFVFRIIQFYIDLIFKL